MLKGRFRYAGTSSFYPETDLRLEPCERKEQDPELTPRRGHRGQEPRQVMRLARRWACGLHALDAVQRFNIAIERERRRCARPARPIAPRCARGRRVGTDQQGMTHGKGRRPLPIALQEGSWPNTQQWGAEKDLYR